MLSICFFFLFAEAFLLFYSFRASVVVKLNLLNKLRAFYYVALSDNKCLTLALFRCPFASLIVELSPHIHKMRCLLDSRSIFVITNDAMPVKKIISNFQCIQYAFNICAKHIGDLFFIFWLRCHKQSFFVT